MNEKIAGALYGMALGDALGAETEFLTIETIRYRYPPSGPLEPPGDPARVTDDTQMALAVGEALIDAPTPYAPDTLADILRTAFINWYDDPENNRAPGNTCLEGCENLISGMHWREAGNISSKGCGANMRVMAVGLIDVDPTTRAAIAQTQSALTHGHATALAAADLTAWVMADLYAGGDTLTLPTRAIDYAQSQRQVYHTDWLGDLWKRAYMMRTPEEFMSYGWDECIVVLNKVADTIVFQDRDTDPCEATGAGWIAEEALGTALLCFLLYQDDPVAAIRRAAFTSGDSDSIACITGAFAGVYKGLSAWPRDWINRIEYDERIEALAEALSEG